MTASLICRQRGLGKWPRSRSRDQQHTVDAAIRISGGVPPGSSIRDIAPAAEFGNTDLSNGPDPPRSAAGPLTVVSAGPGAGKTLTAASWALSGVAGGARVAWLSLDDSDDDPQSFWRNLFNALNASGGVPPGSTIRDITPAAEFGTSELSRAFDPLAKFPAPVILVLDDFQEITHPAVIESVDRLIDRQLPTLRLVLLGRADPPLRLHRLRVPRRRRRRGRAVHRQ